MKQNMIEIQIYYEIAMAIGNSLNLKKTLKESLSAYLRKLDCSAGLVLHLRQDPQGFFSYVPIHTIPRNLEKNPTGRAAVQAVPAALAPEPLAAFLGKLPALSRGDDGRFYHLMELQDFGLLVLIKSDRDLDSAVIRSLKPLNEKLARACIACLQKEELESINERMKAEIQERKETQDALRESEKRYRIAIENSNDGVAIVNGDVSLYVNKKFTEIFGYEQPEEIIDKTFALFVHPDDLQLVQETSRARQQGKMAPSRYEFKGIRKDRKIVNIEVSVSRITYQGQSVSLAYLRDITERKQLEASLQQVQKMEAIGTLAGGIAHNFNNLLMGIQGNASIARLDTDPSHPAYLKLETIEKLVRNGALLTNQLLDYARGGQYNVKLLDLNQLVKKTAETFAVTRKEIQVHQDLVTDLFCIRADRGQIEQVLLNLYINAGDAMPNGGELFLQTRNTTHEAIKGRKYEAKSGTYVMMSVRDTGVGMDEKIQERIFDPFFTTKEVGKGTGLGLASVHGIVKAHGGYIDVFSAKGRGAIFEICLPAYPREGVKEQPVIEEMPEGKGQVLLVDDEEPVLNVTRLYLERLGYDVLMASSGKEALAVYQENPGRVAAVILDMILPEMGGGEVYDKLKEIDPKVRVLLSTGYSMDGKAAEILLRGCDGFIHKPFNLEELSKKLAEIIDKA
jgi:PAS domain S-box-containing protein